MRRISLPLVCLLALAACSSRPPNLVLVIGDDQGWMDYGFMGSTVVHTPRLDALAAQGTVYTRAFDTASSCRASLRSLLTGLQPLAWDARAAALRARGVRLGPAGLVATLDTLPRALARRGYVSFQGGKYWEGRFADGGFSEGLTPDRPRRSDLRSVEGGPAALALGRQTMQPLWDFLDAHRGEPFFVWFAPMLPHTPHDAGPEYQARYAGADLSPAARAYYANVSRFDDRVGELLDRLDALGRARDTVVVYLSDNGWDQEPHARLAGLSGGPRGKHTLYEIGFRTPLVLRWPGHLPAGVRRRELVSSLDVFATLLDLAGAPLPPGRTGASLLPSLLRGERWPRDRVFGSMDALRPRGGGWPVRARGWFLRTDAWRYLWYEDQGVEELYAIEDDPREQRDIAAREPERVAAFREAVKHWRARVRRAAAELPPQQLHEQAARQ